MLSALEKVYGVIPNRHRLDVLKWWARLCNEEKVYISICGQLYRDPIMVMIDKIMDVYFPVCGQINSKMPLESGVDDKYEYLVNHEYFEPEIIEWWYLGDGSGYSWNTVKYNGQNFKLGLDKKKVIEANIPMQGNIGKYKDGLV